MSLGDSGVVLLALAWTVLPGLLLALAVGVRDWIVLMGSAAPVGIAIFTLASELTAMVGVRYSPVSVIVVLLVVLAICALSRLAVRRVRFLRAAPEGGEILPYSPDNFLTPTSHGAGRAMVSTGVLLMVAAPILGVLTWWRAIGPISTYNQDHDSINHQLLVAYIDRTGRAAPWEVLPGDLLSGTFAHSYPAGLHRLAALIGTTAGDPVSGLNASLIVLCGAMWTLGAASLTAVVLRNQDSSPAWQLAGGGLTALLAAGAYRPAVALVRDNGVMANGVALALVPGVVAVLLALRQARSTVVLIAALACAGVLAVHPSSAVSVGITVFAVMVGSFTSVGTRARLGGHVRGLVAVGLVTAALSAPVVLGALSSAGATSQFPSAETGESLAVSLGRIVTVPYGGFLDPGFNAIQVALLIPLCVGLAATLWTRTGFGLTCAWATWVVISASLFRDPENGPLAPIGAFFYNSVNRVIPHVALVVPGIGAVGVLVLAQGARKMITHVARIDTKARFLPSIGWERATRDGWVAVLLVVVFGAGYLAVPGRSYSTTLTSALASRWSKPEFNRVNQNDEAASAFLSAHVRPGERVMNSANDGSTYAYVKYGVPLVNMSTVGSGDQPYTYDLLAGFNKLATDPSIRKDLLELDIAWVYVDAGAPVIGSEVTPNNWWPYPQFTVAPGLSDLSSIPDLRLAFQAGEVSVYEVNLAALRVL